MSKSANGTDVFDQLIEESFNTRTPTTTDTPPVATDPDMSESTASGNPGRRWPIRIAALLISAIFVAASSTAGYLGWQTKRHNDIESAARDALAAAEHYAVVLTSVDATDIDGNFRQVLDGSTGEFKDMYTQASAQLRQVLIDNKASSKGTVVDAAVKSAGIAKVDVLLFIDQSISNVVNTHPRLDRSRIGMTMELVDHRWLASKIVIS